MECLSVRELRRRWKPIKQRLGEEHPDHPTIIRLHRSFSWLARCQDEQLPEDHDQHLLFLWIAFNALYGQWDDKRREPLPDRECWRKFVDRLLKLDTSHYLPSLLKAQRQAVRDILDDPYVSKFFWEDPGEKRAKQSSETKYVVPMWYENGDWDLILKRLIDRIYLQRCQLVHGAATYAGSLNRRSLQRSVAMLRHLLNGVLLIIIDHGARQDWGTMCYPPLDKTKMRPKSSPRTESQ